MLRQAFLLSTHKCSFRFSGRREIPRVAGFKMFDRALRSISRPNALIRPVFGNPRPWSRLRVCNLLQVSCSSLAEQPDKARGGLPRFHVDDIPKCEGLVAKLEGDEFWHMTKVLRLKVDDKVELFDGKGGIVGGRLVSVNRHNAEVTAMENPRILSPAGPNWHVAAAFCTLKGGRGEWLVEKCTELGATTLTPLMTARSSVKSGGRSDRWDRIAMAATRQCQRLHSMEIKPPTSIEDLLPQVSEVEVALVAAAGAPPLYKSLAELPSTPQTGILFIGPEGDFTSEEIDLLMQSGTKPVGLGPRRLRVETAAVALLAGVMLMADVDGSISGHSKSNSLAHAVSGIVYGGANSTKDSWDAVSCEESFSSTTSKRFERNALEEVLHRQGKGEIRLAGGYPLRIAEMQGSGSFP